jgi:hypothetical protein
VICSDAEAIWAAALDTSCAPSTTFFSVPCMVSISALNARAICPISSLLPTSTRCVRSLARCASTSARCIAATGTVIARMTHQPKSSMNNVAKATFVIVVTFTACARATAASCCSLDAASSMASSLSRPSRTLVVIARLSCSMITFLAVARSPDCTALIAGWKTVPSSFSRSWPTAWDSAFSSGADPVAT